jgi:rRNA biogenesis protein RRP5
VVQDPTQLPPGTVLSAIVTSISSANSSHHGLWVQVCPGISGFVPALELTDDPENLNDLAAHYKIGSRIVCCAMETKAGSNDGNGRKKPSLRHLQNDDHDDARDDQHPVVELSVLLLPKEGGGDTSAFKPTKPQSGDLVVGRISTKSRALGPPALMLNLRGGHLGRCCITELADVDSWENMPLGKAVVTDKGTGNQQQQQRVVSDSEADNSAQEQDEDDKSVDGNEASSDTQGDYPDGRYVKCRVLGNTRSGGSRSKGTLELSLRDSRVEGNKLEVDPTPSTNDMAHAYVVSTTKKGCFVRLSRDVEGRVILKELSDDFLPNPAAMFPPGRLVVGKVKGVKQNNERRKNSCLSAMVDLDLRESVLLAGGDRVTLDDIEENSKYTGVITRVETYGVFVRIDNSDVSGLAHVSECSDNYVKNLFDLYNPGDLVKLIVVKVDKEQKRLGFSLKASNFVDDSDNDDDSDDESTSSGSSSSAMEVDGKDGGEDGALDSDDEDFVSKLAKKMEDGDDGMDVDDDDESTASESGSSDGSSDSDSESSDDEDDEVEKPEKNSKKTGSLQAMETDVGFDWGGITASKTTSASKLGGDESSSDDDSSSSSDESDDEDEDADSGFKSSHRSRKKAAAKRREEEETSRREAALADGTADETPETSADFERLVASSPNSSEVWIRYMAFHLSLADIDSARSVASRAFDRIEFRQEGEKLNVWTALLTLELKYGTDKSLNETVDRACQQNNPKQVYLRVCELLDKEVDSSANGSNDVDAATSRADDMFLKMCKKFKSKKSVWLAHFQYLLKGSRHEEAHALLKRSLQSLPTYKHVEVMSKFAQMEFELGSPERGRTIFNALLEKHPKRMDLLFVNIDKEIKNGDIEKARALFDSVANPTSTGGGKKKFKFSDKQMKSLFKKWYRMEEEHGDEASQERVKEEARAFVTKANP